MKTSDEIEKIAAALAKAQDGLRNAHRDRQNPHLRNKYATLESVLEAVRPALAAAEVSILQGLGRDDNEIIVTTRLLHSSGQWIESVLSMPIASGKGTTSAQQAGVSITYARRYALMAMVCISSSDEDNDGNAAAPPPRRERFDLPKALGVTPEVLDAVCAYKGFGGHGAWRGWDDDRRKLFMQKHPAEKVSEYVALAAREMRDRFHARYAKKPRLGEDCDGDKAAWEQAKEAWDVDRKRVLTRLYGVFSAGDLSITQAVGKHGLGWLKPENQAECQRVFAKAAQDQREAA